MEYRNYLQTDYMSNQKANIAEKKRNPRIHASEGYVQAKSYRFILLYKYTKFLPE